MQKEENKIFRYPGGKKKLDNKIVESINKYYEEDVSRISTCSFVEPFVGAGAICRKIISQDFHPKKIIINDLDYGISSFWNSVIFYPEELIERTKDFIPTVDSFFEFKEYLSKKDINTYPFIDVGFKKMAIHQISYSGLGVRAGGPLGGLSQDSKYPIDCRWNPDFIIRNIIKYNRIFKDIEIKEGCLNKDVIDVIKDCADKDVIFYLDPPYFLNGKNLYLHYYIDEDHVSLMENLKKVKFPWILSYDAEEKIRELYEWAYIEEVDVSCTINTKKGSKIKKEFLIVPADYKFLIKRIKKDTNIIFGI